MRQILLLCMISLILIVACKKKENDREALPIEAPSDTEHLKEVADRLVLAFTHADSAEAVHYDFPLNAELDHGVSVNWESSNSSVLKIESQTARVTKVEKDTEVTLSANLKLGETSTEKSFKLTVAKPTRIWGTCQMYWAYGQWISMNVVWLNREVASQGDFEHWVTRNGVVHVAGATRDYFNRTTYPYYFSLDSKQVTRLTKNGVQCGGSTYGIDVLDEDVYISGTCGSNGYWKNGVWSDSSEFALAGLILSSPLATDKHLYFFGLLPDPIDSRAKPGFLLNGSWTFLPLGDELSLVDGITTFKNFWVIDSDIYLSAGYLRKDNLKSIVLNWKNGALWNPTIPGNEQPVEVFEMFKSDGKVYLFLKSTDKSGYWEDGVWRDLTLENLVPRLTEYEA